MARKASSNIAIDTVPLPDRTVRVSVPLKVSHNLRSFQKIQAEVLGRLGCPACCSGFDIRYDTIRSFSVDEKMKVHDLVSGINVTDG